MSGLLTNHNFAKSALASGIADSDLSLDLVAGDGAKFPASGDFVCVLWDSAYASPVSDLTREIIKVTDRSTDALTIVRAQEGTSAKAWNADDHCALVITAGKLDELEEELSYRATTGNLLQNASWANWDVTADCPAGWTLTGAGAAVTFANGTYGWRKLTLTAGAGAAAKLTQTLPADLPKIAGDYSLGAFALVDSGGTGHLVFDSIDVEVTETSATLKQGSGTVSAWNFEIQIDATHAITVELPTVVLGNTPPYPMYGAKDIIGLHNLGPAGRGKYCGEMAYDASISISLAKLAKASTATMLGVTCYWQGLTTTTYGGILQATQSVSSGGTYKGPVIYATGAKSSTTDADGYVCMFATGNVLTIRNRLKSGATSESAYVAIDYIWG